MQRSCDACGKLYEAKRVTSKYCGSGCRTRVSRAEKPKTPVRIGVAAQSAFRGGLYESTLARLEEVGRLETVLGQQALFLAQRLEASLLDSGSSLASLSKELRAVMDAALEGVAKAADPVDELRRRREAKLTG